MAECDQPKTESQNTFSDKELIALKEYKTALSEYQRLYRGTEELLAGEQPTDAIEATNMQATKSKLVNESWVRWRAAEIALGGMGIFFDNKKWWRVPPAYKLRPAELEKPYKKEIFPPADI